MARALEGREFAGLTGAVEEKLGKKLTTPDLDRKSTRLNSSH